MWRSESQSVQPRSARTGWTDCEMFQTDATNARILTTAWNSAVYSSPWVLIQNHLTTFPTVQRSLQIPSTGSFSSWFSAVILGIKGRGLPAMCPFTPHLPSWYKSIKVTCHDPDCRSWWPSDVASQHQDRRQTDSSHRDRGNTILAQWYQQMFPPLAGNQNALQGPRCPHPYRVPQAKHLLHWNYYWHVFILFLQQNRQYSSVI